MSEPSTVIVFWKGLVKFLPSIIGAFIAVISSPAKPDSTWKQRITAAFVAMCSGVSVAHFGGDAIIAYLSLVDPLIQDGIKFALGLFGLTLINNIVSEINPWLTSLRQKIFGENK